MRRATWMKLALALTLTATSSSCGGGTASFGGGIGGTGLVIGPITDFGSIFVEGVEFDTTTANVTVDGIPANAADLALGMIVTVSGEIDAEGIMGVADTVEFESVLEGPVTAIDVATKSATVLGQTIHVRRDTVLVGVAVDSSVIGVPVRVSGFVDADRIIQATRVARRSVGGRLVFTGRIRQIDTLAQTFAVRGMTVDFSSAVIDSVPPDGLHDGLVARVTVIAMPVGNTVQAVRVSFREPAVEKTPGVEVRLAGFIRSVPAANEFLLGDLATVRTTATTKFFGGTATDIAPNVKIGLVGRATKSRIVIASKIVFL